MTDKELKMSFDPKTIEHLGIKMYSRLPNAIAELIANAYDACATEVIVHLQDEDPGKKSIIVEDDGVGMTFNEVNDKFLRIGRNRREDGETELPCGRMVTGKKGLGKLAFFGIGDVIQVETCKEGEKTTFVLDWNKLIHTPSGEDYKPESISEKCVSKSHGTTITLTKLKRKTGFNFESLAKSLAKLFNFQGAFIVLLIQNNDQSLIIDNKLKYEGIEPEFDWEFPDTISNLLDTEYKNQNKVSGVIVTTEKPIKPALRGITLFANGRMVNDAEFFGSSESSHFFSYTTGWLDVDFVDNWEEDVISTNRQSLDWENEKTIQLRNFLIQIVSAIHKDWRKQRKEKRRDDVQKNTEIDIRAWYDTLEDNIKDKIEIILEKVDDSELPQSEQAKTISALHDLVPEYPKLHWRHLHPEIKKVSKSYYESGHYYAAFFEALQRYITEVRKKSREMGEKERNMMRKVFGNKILSVTQKYIDDNKAQFSDDTLESIEMGQAILSEGIVVGGRNPLAHQSAIDLSASGLFSEKDCLDFLSLLSHLFKRLDDAVALENE